MNNNVKASYKAIIEFLELNKQKKVATIMPELLAMVTSKTMAKTFKTNDEGKVTHIFCYYHKEWEDVTLIEYGTKKSSSTKLNTMCKEGVSHWSKQQRMSKTRTSDLLTSLANGDIAIDDLDTHKDAIEQDRIAIVPRSDDNDGSQDES